MPPDLGPITNSIRVHILTSCTGEKQYSPEHPLQQEDFQYLYDPFKFRVREQRLSDFYTVAQDLYSGQQHVRLMQGVRFLRQSRGESNLVLKILSAGYGLIDGDRKIVPYECTFQGMKVGEVRTWAKHLGIPTAVREYFTAEADLMLVLLGESYLRALDLDNDVVFASPTLFLASDSSRRWVRGKGHFKVIPLSPAEAKRFSWGLVGLKGELARRILIQIAETGQGFISRLLAFNADVLTLLDQIDAGGR